MYRLIEHTADMGIEARGDSPARVLREMALGLKAMMFGDSPALPTESTRVTVHAEDLTDLLVCWLNEVVYWSEKNNLVPSEFDIALFSGTALRATVSGEPFDPLRHAVERQVKSVTYHQACLEKVADGWHARVYIDL
jgi:SHS2 domain-containing protein